MDEDDSHILDIDKEGGDAGASTGAREERVEEHLLIKEGFDGRKVWLVKVPKFLQERWAEVTEEDLHLATLRVYNVPPGSNTAPRISLILPEDPKYKADDLPAEFDLVMAPGADHEGANKSSGFVLSEKKPEAGRIHPTLFSRIHHEASLQPVLSPQYRALVRKRQELAAKPKRTLMRLNEDKLGAAKIAQLASGVSGDKGNKGRFGGFKPPPAKKPSDKAVRLPRNELLDVLFSLFEQHQYWTLKAIREKTRQPEVYLKEVLGEVANLARRGPYTGTWCLKENFRTAQSAGGEGEKAKQQQQEVKAEAEAVKEEEEGAGAVKAEGGGDDDDESDDDDDEDEDMEEL